MERKYFLGANTAQGFYSLYDSFPPPHSFLHIIKGGPGTGKSSFMRKLAAAALEQGLDVEYVLCSGDPDSLDGIYIPALNAAWCDGTAPHAIEPRCFAVDSDYVNLGEFCRGPVNESDAAEIESLTARYKAHYAAAYDELRQAKELHDELEAVYKKYMDFAALDEFTLQQIEKHIKT